MMNVRIYVYRCVCLTTAVKGNTCFQARLFIYNGNINIIIYNFSIAVFQAL